MGMGRINIDFDQVLVLIRFAITEGRAECAIPLIDDARQSLASKRVSEEDEKKPDTTEPTNVLEQ